MLKNSKAKLNKDHPVPVMDEVAESGIKWIVVVLGFVSLLLSGIGAIGLSYIEQVSGTMVRGMNKIDLSMSDMNTNLILIRGEISQVNTGVQVNAAKIHELKESANQRFLRNEKNIDELRAFQRQHKN